METKKIEIPSLVYDPKDGWIITAFDQTECAIKDVSEIKFLTYNVWFENHNFDERGVELRKIMEQSDADFICLQEVIKGFFDKILDTDWVQKKYSISAIKITSYHTIILTKHKSKFFLIPFPTGQGRYFLYSSLMINGKQTAIGCVHLESLNNASKRKAQLQISFKEFENFPRAFILGDHNFDNRQEDANIISGYSDMWKVVHPKDKGSTMPPSGGYSAWRPDKILVKNDRSIELSKIEIIGQDPIPKYKQNPGKDWEVKTPSDHYGLVALIKLEVEKKHVEPISKKKLAIVWADTNINSEENLKTTQNLKDKYKAFGDVFVTDNVPTAFDIIEGIKDSFENCAFLVNYPNLFSIWMDYKKDFKLIHSLIPISTVVLTVEDAAMDSQDILNGLNVLKNRVILQEEELIKYLDGLIGEI